MTKIYPILALGIAYIYAGITFSSFPVLESSAKKKVEKVLKEHYPDAKLNHIRRSRLGGMITSYQEFYVSINNGIEDVIFWQINYEDFNKENLNPAPSLDDAKTKVNRILKELNLDDRYKVIHLKYAYHTTMKENIKNAFYISIYDKKGGNRNMKFIYLYEINKEKFADF